jgi:hypothetical protein
MALKLARVRALIVRYIGWFNRFFVLIVGFDLLQVLIVPGYLLAHQAGYFVGAYFSYDATPDQQGGSAHQNQITLPANS